MSSQSDKTVDMHQQDSEHLEGTPEDSFKIEQGHAPSSWTPEEEKKALRKLDWCLIPL